MTAALVLIGLGIIFLLGNLGVMSADPWRLLAQFWPLILVAFGLDLVLNRRYRGVAVAAVALVGVLLFIGWNNAPFAQAAVQETISQSAEGARRAEVTIGSSVARVQIGAHASGDLIEGAVQTGQNETLTKDFRVAGGTAFYRLESQQHNVLGFPIGRQESRLWTLSLSRELPLDLDIDAGIGGLELDLSQLSVRKLQLDTGIGETTLTLPRSGHLNATVKSGIGATTIRLPEGVPARIRISSGLGSVSVSGNYSRQGDVYVSPDYNGAANRIDLDVSGGIGSIDITPY